MLKQIQSTNNFIKVIECNSALKFYKAYLISAKYAQTDTTGNSWDFSLDAVNTTIFGKRLFKLLEDVHHLWGKH